jgi:hypothetical protein
MAGDEDNEEWGEDGGMPLATCLVRERMAQFQLSSSTILLMMRTPCRLIAGGLRLASGLLGAKYPRSCIGEMIPSIRFGRV